MCRKRYSGLGRHNWDMRLNHNGRKMWVSVKRGRYLGKVYGNRAYSWHGTVIENGKIIWNGEVNKNVSARALATLAV